MLLYSYTLSTYPRRDYIYQSQLSQLAVTVAISMAVTVAAVREGPKCMRVKLNRAVAVALLALALHGSPTSGSSAAAASHEHRQATHATPAVLCGATATERPDLNCYLDPRCTAAAELDGDSLLRDPASSSSYAWLKMNSGATPRDCAALCCRREQQIGGSGGSLLT